MSGFWDPPLSWTKLLLPLTNAGTVEALPGGDTPVPAMAAYRVSRFPVGPLLAAARATSVALPFQIRTQVLPPSLLRHTPFWLLFPFTAMYRTMPPNSSRFGSAMILNPVDP